MNPSTLPYNYLLGNRPTECADASSCSFKAKKQATFSPSSQLIVVPRVDDAWYSEDELKSQKMHNIRLVAKARALLSAHHQGISRTGDDEAAVLLSRAETLGIERHLCEVARAEYKRRKREVYQAVDLEQTYQRHFGCANPTRLAVVCSHQSRGAMRQARMRALSLEHDLASSD